MSACLTSRSAMTASPDAPGTTQRISLVPRRRVGPARGRRRPDLREALPGGLPERLVVAHDPAQARELRRAFAGFDIEAVARSTSATWGGSSVTPGSCGTAARSRRPSPTRRRARIAAVRRIAGRVDLEVRAGQNAPAQEVLRAAGQHSRVDRAVEGPPQAWVPLRRTNNRIRGDAGLGRGQRPSGRLCIRGGGRCRARRPDPATVTRTRRAIELHRCVRDRADLTPYRSLASLGRNQEGRLGGDRVGVGPAEPALCPCIVASDCTFRVREVSDGCVRGCSSGPGHRQFGDVRPDDLQGSSQPSVQAGRRPLLLVVPGRGVEGLHRLRQGDDRADRQQRPEAGDG